MTLLLVAGQLWREIPSTGGWYTVAEVGPGLYAYRYSDDPSQAAHSPAHSGAGGSQRRRIGCSPSWSRT